MYYFKYQMKIQLIPYIQLDVKNFVDAFRRVLSNTEWKQKYFRVMKKKIKQIQDFHDNNFADFRVHMVLRSRKILLDFWKQNTQEFQQLNNQHLQQRIYEIEENAHKRVQNYVDTVSIKSDHIFKNQLNSSASQADKRLRTSQIISFSHNPQKKQVKKVPDNIQIVTQNNPFKKSSKYVISARENTSKQKKIRKDSSKGSLNQSQSIYSSGSPRITFANNKYFGKKHFKTQVSQNLQVSKQKKLIKNGSKNSSQDSKNGWHQIKKKYVNQQPTEQKKLGYNEQIKPGTKQSSTKLLSKEVNKPIKKIVEPVNKKMTKQQYILYLKSKKN